MPDQLPDNLPAAQKFMTAPANPDHVPATAEHIAAGIYEAATDGEQQLRYPLGDAPHTVAMRREVGDDAFMANIRQSIFG